VNPTQFDANHWEQLIETGCKMFLNPDGPEWPDFPHKRQLQLMRQAQWHAKLYLFVNCK
jgi:hypothetical protein